VQQRNRFRPVVVGAGRHGDGAAGSDHQMPDTVRCGQREPLCDRSAVGEPEHVRALRPEYVQQRQQVAGHRRRG
jgi:hypothetical protein